MHTIIVCLVDSSLDMCAIIHVHDQEGMFIHAIMFDKRLQCICTTCN